ncbi:MAG: hypothetical protein QGH17_08775, partial [Candidatus Marinimicrobia bacterium]|jgi:hypothetical protein|nr:hypothetical protein [Candidatus Neomarinimicrobiota bacterium]|tara:strand:- start:2364 stop:2585 length:222 start_codon:yes stop_codon:yes gene_type:complete
MAQRGTTDGTTHPKTTLCFSTKKPNRNLNPMGVPAMNKTDTHSDIIFRYLCRAHNSMGVYLILRGILLLEKAI